MKRASAVSLAQLGPIARAQALVQIDRQAVRRSKFGAERTTLDGVSFASRSEARRFAELQQAERAGLISRLERQPKFPLVIDGAPVLIRSEGYPNGRAAVYRADFAYFEDGQRIVEEHKGRDDTASRLRRAGAAPVDVCCRLLCDWRTVARVADAVAAEGGRS